MTEELGAQGMLRRPVQRQGRVRGRTFWMLPSTVEGRDGAPTRGVVRAPSSMSLRSMLARIASRGPARSSHVAWMRALAASKRLGDAISWWGRSSARELAADSSARIAASCRRQSSTSASASDAAARAAPLWRAAASRCRSLSAMLLLKRRRRWQRAAAFRWLASLAMAFACTAAACRQCSSAWSARAQHSCSCCSMPGERAGRRGVGGGATGR